MLRAVSTFPVGRKIHEVWIQNGKKGVRALPHGYFGKTQKSTGALVTPDK